MKKMNELESVEIVSQTATVSIATSDRVYINAKLKDGETRKYVLKPDGEMGEDRLL